LLIKLKSSSFKELLIFNAEQSGSKSSAPIAHSTVSGIPKDEKKKRKKILVCQVNILRSSFVKLVFVLSFSPRVLHNFSVSQYKTTYFLNFRKLFFK